jgi:predicted phage tail protein
MTNLDQAIRQALSAEDAEFLARFEKETIVDDVLGTFRGQWGALNIFAAIITFALFGAFVYCAWNAFTAPDTRATILWSAGALMAMLGVAMLKMYFWMEMNKNIMLREVKRLELQVARLAASRTVP